MRPSNGKTCALLVSLLLFTVLAQRVEAQTYTIELQGLTWNHPTLNILIIPKTGMTWWRGYYLNATLRAIGEWNFALHNFSGYDPQFSFLFQVRLVPMIGDRIVRGFDIYLTWVEQYNGSEAIGVSQAAYRAPCTMVNNTVTLAASIRDGPELSEADSQNAATHELGHALGLGHAPVSGDVMYPRLPIGGPIQPISTLDAYGVWQVMRWLGSTGPGQQTCPGSSASLPPGIAYRYLPLQYSVPPVSQPWRIVFSLLQNYLWLIFLVTGLLIVVATIVRWMRDMSRPVPSPITYEGN